MYYLGLVLNCVIINKATTIWVKKTFQWKYKDTIT